MGKRLKIGKDNIVHFFDNNNLRLYLWPLYSTYDYIFEVNIFGSFFKTDKFC